MHAFIATATAQFLLIAHGMLGRQISGKCRQDVVQTYLVLERQLLQQVHLAREQETGSFCHGDTPTMADICLASQVIGALAYFHCDTSGVPATMRIYNRCMEIDAFALAHPLKQPGAKAH